MSKPDPNTAARHITAALAAMHPESFIGVQLKVFLGFIAKGEGLDSMKAEWRRNYARLKVTRRPSHPRRIK